MNRKALLVGLAFVALAGVTAGVAVSADEGGKKPMAAQAAVDAAVTKVKKSKKVVFVDFSASWCGWCKRLDAALHSDKVKPVFEKYFEPVQLIVLENGDKKALENPGSDKLLKDWGGANGGIPFFVFLDASGKKIGDSNVMPKNQNIGYPGSPEEIAAFEALLKKVCPKMKPEDLSTIITYLKENAPKD